MIVKELHPRIQALKLRAEPVNYSVTAAGELDAGDLADAPEVEEVDDKIEYDSVTNIIKGYAAVWGRVDTYGTVFVKGCFAKSIQERGPDSRSKYKIVGCWQHNLCDPIGRITKLQEDEYGLYFELTLDDFNAVPNAKRSAYQIKSGTINQFSFGFEYLWDKMEYDQNTDAVLVLECELFEISPVTIGSQSETYAIRSKENWKSLKLEFDDDLDTFIKSIPREKQLELRQILLRQSSLTRAEPPEIRQKALKEKRSKPNQQTSADNGKFNLSLILKNF